MSVPARTTPSGFSRPRQVLSLHIVRLNMARLQHGCIFLQTKNREIEGKILPYTFLNVIEVTQKSKTNSPFFHSSSEIFQEYIYTPM